MQPPSGGCVLKLLTVHQLVFVLSAAFGRLCVETVRSSIYWRSECQPPSGGCVLKPFLMGFFAVLSLTAAFGRLCVETQNQLFQTTPNPQPPSGGCVLKLEKFMEQWHGTISRLRAAVC